MQPFALIWLEFHAGGHTARRRSRKVRRFASPSQASQVARAIVPVGLGNILFTRTLIKLATVLQFYGRRPKA